MKSIHSKFVLFLFTTLAFTPAHARIEYALTHHQTSCTSCHASPFGGGPRYVDGKLYGSRNDEPSEWSYQDKWCADVRAISYYPKGGTTSRQGTALMTTSVSVNLPIKKKADGSELRVVGVYGLGMVQLGARDIYGQWMSKAKTEKPVYIQVGRFNIPFGLMTDEHRTYTKLLTRTEVFDYEFGTSLSGDLVTGGLHYDFALTNGLQSGGNFNANSTTTPDATSGAFANVRVMPNSLPLLAGLSAGAHQRMSRYNDPVALAAYTAISLDRLTGNFLSGSILAEYVWADNWGDSTINPNINRYFAPAASTYETYIRNKSAVAWYGQINLNITPRWVLQYKYDRLTFDPKYSGDQFDRNGFGVKYFADSNIILMSRYETTYVGRPEIKGTNVIGDQNAFWLMLQLWL